MRSLHHQHTGGHAPLSVDRGTARSAPQAAQQIIDFVRPAVTSGKEKGEGRRMRPQDLISMEIDRFEASRGEPPRAASIDDPERGRGQVREIHLPFLCTPIRFTPPAHHAPAAFLSTPPGLMPS